jgi:thiol-disulfide isomerase/thioredoxin
MIRFLACTLTALLSIPLVLPLVLARGAGDKGDDKPLNIKGKLSDDDPKDTVRKGSPAKIHKYKMTKGQAYVISLDSDDFDAFLRLENPAGKQVAMDDDSGGGPRGLNARIIHKAADAGEYKIIVTSYDTKSGDYTLTVRKATDDEAAKAGKEKADPFEALLGKKAPEIAGEFTLNGDAKKLSDLKGKVVLVDFWAVWCGPCIATFPHLRDWSKEFRKEGLEIVGVTTYFEKLGFDKEAGKLKPLQEAMKPAEEHDMLKDFIAHHKLTHEILVVSKDAWKKASDDYRFRGIPTAVLIDRQGVVRMVRVGSGPQNAADLEAEIKKLLAQK